MTYKFKVVDKKLGNILINPVTQSSDSFTFQLKAGTTFFISLGNKQEEIRSLKRKIKSMNAYIKMLEKRL